MDGTPKNWRKIIERKRKEKIVCVVYFVVAFLGIIVVVFMVYMFTLLVLS